MTHSARANFIKIRLILYSKKGTTGATQAEAAAPISGLAAGPTPDPFAATEKLNLAILKDLAGRVRAGNGHLLLVFIPKYQGLFPETDADRVSHQFHEALPGWAAQAGIPLLDMTPILQNAMARSHLEVGNLYHLKDGHCTPRSYTLIAKTIADHLRAHPNEF